MIAKLKFFSACHFDEAAGASCGGAEEQSYMPCKVAFQAYSSGV